MKILSQKLSKQKIEDLKAERAEFTKLIKSDEFKKIEPLQRRLIRSQADALSLYIRTIEARVMHVTTLLAKPVNPTE